MNIIASYKKSGQFVRHLVSEGGRLYRRIVAGAIWQEQIHTGDFHNIFGQQAEKLEAQFSQLAMPTKETTFCV